MKSLKKFIKCFSSFFLCRNQAIFVAILLYLFLFYPMLSIGANRNLQTNQYTNAHPMKVGVASVDITPKGPIRLAGYAARKNKESEGVLGRLHAKALAFSGKDQGLSILITVDLVGITNRITSTVAKYLSKKIGLNRAQFVICASHTHSGPEIGNLINIIQYSEYNGNSSNIFLLPGKQLVHIAKYKGYLISQLKKVAMAAVEDLKPALVTWGEGQVGFAVNRDNRPKGPVDHTMDMLRIASSTGKLRAILVRYSCHNTTLAGKVNKISGDWAGAAQRVIEKRHPGTIALVALGTAGDANPKPRGKLKYVNQHGEAIADEVDKLLNSDELHPLTAAPVGHFRRIKLPFAHVPTKQELIQQTKEKGIKGYYARLALERVLRGRTIPSSLPYPIQVWTFGDELAMISMGGEVVAHYSLRLRKELENKHLWINAYSNDIHSYITSHRMIRHGGYYEVNSSMYWYNNPSPFVEEIEDMIIGAVYGMLPTSFLTKK